MSVCIFPKCEHVRERDLWCYDHWALFPHPCEQDGCDARPIYDDEPYCFVHSPDEGSSFKGYSAYRKFLESIATHPSNSDHE